MSAVTDFFLSRLDAAEKEGMRKRGKIRTCDLHPSRRTIRRANATKVFLLSLYRFYSSCVLVQKQAWDASATNRLHDTGQHSKIFKVRSAVSKLFRRSFRVFSVRFLGSLDIADHEGVPRRPRGHRSPSERKHVNKTGYGHRATRMEDNKWLFRAELTTVLFAARPEDRQQKEKGWNGFTELDSATPLLWISPL